MTGRALTIIRTNFAPLGFDVGPPAFSLDEAQPSSSENVILLLLPCEQTEPKRRGKTMTTNLTSLPQRENEPWMKSRSSNSSTRDARSAGGGP